MDKYTLARAAQSELPATEAAYEQLRQGLIDLMLATAPHDTLNRESLYHQITGLDALRDRMKHFVSSDAYEAAAREANEE